GLALPARPRRDPRRAAARLRRAGRPLLLHRPHDAAPAPLTGHAAAPAARYPRLAAASAGAPSADQSARTDPDPARGRLCALHPLLRAAPLPAVLRANAPRPPHPRGDPPADHGDRRDHVVADSGTAARVAEAESAAPDALP